MHRARGVRRGLGQGQSWDESAARVERKRWSYLKVSPEVAVYLVATTATQAGRVESHTRDPVLWVTAARKKPRCRGLRRGLGQTRDQSAVGVERKLWSYLRVSPEVAVCLVPRSLSALYHDNTRSRGLGDSNLEVNLGGCIVHGE